VGELAALRSGLDRHGKDEYCAVRLDLCNRRLAFLRAGWRSFGNGIELAIPQREDGSVQRLRRRADRLRLAELAARGLVIPS